MKHQEMKMRTKTFILFFALLAHSTLFASPAGASFDNPSQNPSSEEGIGINASSFVQSISTDLLGNWKILKIKNGNARWQKMKKIGAELRIQNKDAFARFEFHNACRGLLLSGDVDQSADGQMTVKTSNDQIVRTTEVRPCDLENTERKKDLQQLVSNLKKGSEIKYVLSGNKKRLKLYFDGQVIDLKRKK